MPENRISTEELIKGLIQHQQSKVLKVAREIVPDATPEDIRNPQDFPELVEGLMIFNSPHYRTKEQQLSIEERVKLTIQFGPKATVSAAINRWFNEKFQLDNPKIIATIKQWVVNNDPSIYPKIYKILAYDLEEIIKPDPPITCPTLVITADKDYGNNPTMSKEIASEINKSQLYILKNLFQ